MLLSARILSHVASVNNYRTVSQVEFTDGDAPSIVFQLVDLSVDKNSEGFNPPGRRYCPAEEAEVTVFLGSVREANRIERIAFQPFPQFDASIWQIDLFPEDKVAGNTDLFIELSENGKVTRGIARNVIRAHPVDGGSC